MISYENWMGIYKKIIELFKEPAVSTLIVLKELNKFVFHYHRNEMIFEDNSGKLTIVDNIISSLDKLLLSNDWRVCDKITLISLKVSLIESLKKIRSEAVQEQRSLQFDATTQAIEKAIDGDDPETARKLLLSDFVIEYKEEITRLILFSYCSYKQEKAAVLAIQLFHEINTDFNCCYTVHGDTPLLCAASESKSVAVLEALIKAGANVNQPSRDSSVYIPLRQAALAVKVDFVKILLASGADPKRLSNIVCLLASSFEADEEKIRSKLLIIKLLVEAGANVDSLNYDGFTPLRKAVLGGNSKFMELLIELGAKLYPDMMLDAIQSNNTELLENLINKHKISLPREIPYSQEINLKMFQLCFSKKMLLGKFSLSDEVVLKTPEAVKYCIQNGACLDIKFDSIPISYFRRPGNSPGDMQCELAHFAAARATRESLAILIAAGLAIHAKDVFGFTPLHYAAAYANPEAVEVLIQAGANVNAANTARQTPLHWSVKNGEAASINISCAKILLAAGANSKFKDAENNTPLECLYNRAYYSDIAEWTEVFALNQGYRKANKLDANTPMLFQPEKISLINQPSFKSNEPKLK